jgi:hypothetical protein
MDIAHLRRFTHKHCRFKLRSGKEVYGVVWEVETSDAPAPMDADTVADDRLLFFASVRDYERLQHQGTPVHVIPMRPEEIVLVESLAS